MDELHHLVQSERAACDQGGVLAHAVPGDDDRPQAAGAQAAVPGDAGDHDREMGRDGIREIGRAGPPLRHVTADDVGRLGQDLPGGLVVEPGVGHAARHAALPLEDDRDPGHVADSGTGPGFDRRPAAASTLSRMTAIWTLLLASIRCVMASVSMGASGRIRKSWTQRIRVPVPSGTYVQRMFMNSKGPGSSRRATTSWAASSRVRSDTQLHTRPDSSGCILSRKRNIGPLCASTSTSLYSVKRSGHVVRSLVIRQTWSMSASMKIELSVWPTVLLSFSRVLIWGPPAVCLGVGDLSGRAPSRGSRRACEA